MGVHLSWPSPDSLSTTPGFAILSPAANRTVPTQDRDVGSRRDDQVFRVLTCTVTRGQPAGPNQHPVTWFTMEVTMTSDRTVIFTWKERIKYAVMIDRICVKSRIIVYVIDHRTSSCFEVGLKIKRLQKEKEAYLQVCPAPPPPTGLLRTASVPCSAPSRPYCSQL